MFESHSELSRGFLGQLQVDLMNLWQLMSSRSSFIIRMDPLALIALIILSLVAPLVIALQMARQYAATTHDYRRCSERSIGKWATRTHRRWKWREIGFEITYSTPRINCAPPSTDFDPVPSPDFEPENSPPSISQPETSHPALTSDVTDCLMSLDERSHFVDAKNLLDRQYRFVDAKDRSNRLGRLRPENDARESRWFLDAKEAIPHAKCSWLTLLEDTIFTDARFTITEMLNSFDFVLPAVRKPLATADKKSFLTLMSLFGVKWNNRGEDTKLLSGAGDSCEIRCRTNGIFQEIYVYINHPKVNDLTGEPLPSTEKYYLVSERARKAMFHCFDLGFATFLTHSEAEIESSMKKSGLGLDPDAVIRVSSFYRDSNQWCPGLSESITCWAAQSMPKAVDKSQNKFKSIFSAISAISLTTGKPKFVRILLGQDTDRCTIPSIWVLTDWSRAYCDDPFLPGKMKSWLLETLRYAAESDVYQNISEREIPWSISRRCLKSVRFLDVDLDQRLLRGFEEDHKRSVKKFISNLQIKYGSSLYTDAAAAAESEGGGSWIHELDRIGAQNYVQIAKDIAGEVGKEPELAQMIVVNRLMRGALWVIHNGNAPNQSDRSLECSLSSTWLLDTSTVYIV